MKINISKMSKAIVLTLLYNESKMQGNSFLGGNGTPMTVEEANKHLETNQDFDYLNGKVMKISLKGDLLETWLYDRDNGEGAALKAIQKHYHDATEMSEDEAKKELFKIQAEGRVNRTGQKTATVVDISEHLKGSATDTLPIKKFKSKIKKKQPVKPQAKIEYKKGFFTVNGQVRKETKLQYTNRVVNTVGKLEDVGFKVKISKPKKK
jgi:hypothetical protein